MAEKGAKGPAFEWWMISNLAVGAGFSAFVALLIPPFVTGATGNAADAGIVMAIISLAAVLGPVLGGLADKYRAHRLVVSLGVLGMALAFAMYGISAEAKAIYALDAIFMGVSVAAVSAVAPVFIVGANLPKALEAKRLTTFNLIAPVGQVLGGALLGAAAAAGGSFVQGFWLAAIVIGTVRTRGGSPACSAIAPMTGNNVAVVARLLVNSVRKMTSATAATTSTASPNALSGARLSPSQRARPEFDTAAARLSPPPNRISTPQGSRVAVSQSMSRRPVASPLGMRNSRMPAITSSGTCSSR